MFSAFLTWIGGIIVSSAQVSAPPNTASFQQRAKHQAPGTKQRQSLNSNFKSNLFPFLLCLAKKHNNTLHSEGFNLQHECVAGTSLLAEGKPRRKPRGNLLCVCPPVSHHTYQKGCFICFVGEKQQIICTINAWAELVLRN